jgi:transcription initiation factor TFIIA small subunit
MCEEIPKKQKNKCTIKGTVKNYKNCDDIWIFYAESVYLRTESESFTSEKLKVVACDAQMKSLYADRRTQDNGDDN